MNSRDDDFISDSGKLRITYFSTLRMRVLKYVSIMPRNSHAKFGKWSQPGVPHRGWNCIDVEDLGEPVQVCEMCEHAEVRYVHKMQHPEYIQTFNVGCVCAERMEEDYVTPKFRERKLKSYASRRSNWLKRKWKVSYGGNLYINVDGFNIVMFLKRYEDEWYWSLCITNRMSKRKKFSRRQYYSAEEAKMAALKALDWAKDSHLLD